MYVAVIITQEINQIREALGRLLSASVDSHLPPAQKNPYAKEAYFRVAYCAPLPRSMLEQRQTLEPCSSAFWGEDQSTSLKTEVGHNVQSRNA